MHAAVLGTQKQIHNLIKKTKAVQQEAGLELKPLKEAERPRSLSALSDLSRFTSQFVSITRL